MTADALIIDACRTPRGIVNRVVLETDAWKARLMEFGRRFGD